MVELKFKTPVTWAEGVVAAMDVFLPEGELKRFYDAITRSELSHENLFLQFAEEYLDMAQVHARLDELLDSEAVIVSKLPIRVANHQRFSVHHHPAMDAV